MNKNSCINIIHSFVEKIDNKDSLTIKCFENCPMEIINEFYHINEIVKKNMLNRPIFGIDLVILGKENYKPNLKDKVDFEELINVILLDNPLESISFGLGGAFPLQSIKIQIENHFSNIRKLIGKYIFHTYEKMKCEPYTIISSKIINDELVILENKKVDKELFDLFEETSIFLLDYVEDLSNGSEIIFINLEENSFIKENFDKVNDLNDLIVDLSTEDNENLVKLNLNIRNEFKKEVTNIDLNNIQNKTRELSEMIKKIIDKTYS